MSSVRSNHLLPPGLVSNLQDVLLRRTASEGNGDPSKDADESVEPSTSTSVNDNTADDDSSKPVVLVTNGDGNEFPGLVYLVEASVGAFTMSMFVHRNRGDKSVSGHSVTLQETIAVTSTELGGATAYEDSGTPVDCVSLALWGALFSLSKPLLVISGINCGSSCEHRMFYSGVVAGAREARMCGVPSLSVSLNWKKDKSQEKDFKDAVSICLPLINAAVRDIKKGLFLTSCLLNIEIPTCPSTNKGFKLTKQSVWRPTPSWQAVSANLHPSGGQFISNQQSLGIQLAQFSQDASAAGAARHLTKQRPNVEIESVGAAGKAASSRLKKYFRLEFVDKEQDNADDDLDFRALESGFVSESSSSLSFLEEFLFYHSLFN